jgi:hypothetical protein
MQECDGEHTKKLLKKIKTCDKGVFFGVLYVKLCDIGAAFQPVQWGLRVQEDNTWTIMPHAMALAQVDHKNYCR